MTDEPTLVDPQTAVVAETTIEDVPTPAGEVEDVGEPNVEEPEAVEDAADSSAPPVDQPATAEAPAAEVPPPSNKRWYVVKVQSGREDSIRDAIERRVKIERLEDSFGQIIVPVEKVTEMRQGKRVTKERKLYPGYLMVEVEYNDRILYLFRETPGVGDFVGGSIHHAPSPMSETDVDRMLRRQGEPTAAGVKHTKPKFDQGDKVKVKEGIFAGMEGEVKEILEAKGTVSIELTIFGRPVRHEFEYWQVESA